MAFNIESDGSIYVDTAFLSDVQGVSEGEMTHLGFGDFSLKFRDGTRIYFERQDDSSEKIPGQSGRKHRVTGPTVMVKAMLDSMRARS